MSRVSMKDVSHSPSENALSTRAGLNGQSCNAASHMHANRHAALSLSRLSNDEAVWAHHARSFRS